MFGNFIYLLGMGFYGFLLCFEADDILDKFSNKSPIDQKKIIYFHKRDGNMEKIKELTKEWKQIEKSRKQIEYQNTN